MGSFSVNRGEFDRRFRTPSGRGGQDLRRRLQRVQTLAKVLAPVRLGGLRSSIIATPPRREGTSLVGTVGSPLSYAAAVHEGRGSRFAPRSWASRGPGPRRYLKNALSAAQ